MMLRALVSDLRAIAGIEVVGLLDARLAHALDSFARRAVHNRSDWEAHFDALVRESDAVSLIAPETDGVLEHLSTRVVDAGKLLLGSRPHAIALAASKLATANALRRAGVAVVPTSRPREAAIVGPCVVKPDDGCGCEDTRRFLQLDAARTWIDRQETPERFVVQPYAHGEAASLSVLAGAERAWLLCVNRQCVELRDDVFCFQGNVVNAIADAGGMFARLAEQVVAAIPGLWGYVGIDVLLAPGGPIVLEVNPRLTTSYVGLRAALGINPAQLVLDLLAEPQCLALPALGARSVEVNVFGIA